jgi:tRNA A-37 threonylcarbamoyl transferase component Bud32
VVNRVTSVLPSAAIECHTAYGQEEVNSHEPTVNVIQDGEDDSSNAGFAATGTSRARDVARPQDLFKNRTDDEEHSFDVISEDGDSKNIERSDKEEAMREEQSLEEQEESLAARHVDQPSQEDFRPRWQLEKDEIQTAKLIGSGGFGEVFDGKCRGRQVAIKMMRNRGGPLQDKIMETFFSEVEVMSKLKHEYITEFIGACFDEDLYCIVTELMSKGSVFDLLHQKRTRLSWSRRIAMTNDAAKGMAYLHGLNVLHRDMKSMNLLVNNQWTVKIADFGLTRFKQHTQTMMSSTRGTPAYMAPELLRNQLVSEKIDVYAFGIVMSEIATRAIPFGDQNMNPLQLMFAVCQGTRPNLPSQDKAPRHFLLLARVCWDERPAKRPSFSMIVQELTTLQTNIPSKFS